MDQGTLFYRSQYGVAVSADNQTTYRLPSMPTLDTETAVARTAAEARTLADYITPKYYLAGRDLTMFWYFGECTDADGNVIPGTAGKDAYPFEIYDDTGNGGYGCLKLADCKVGRIIITGARANLTYVVDNTNTLSGGTGIEDDANEPLTDFALGTATFATTTWAALTGTKGNIIPSTAGDGTLGAGTWAGLSTYGTTPEAMLDNSGGTAATAGTAATITSIVTGATVLAATQNAFANIIKQVNNLIDIVGGRRSLALDGTGTAVDFYLNGIVDDAKQDAGADNGLSGELLLSGVVEIQMQLLGDI